jgi:tRNA threonylcarbamoyladenosine modification (KEOPS) complex  Pcc1 subunit
LSSKDLSIGANAEIQIATSGRLAKIIEGSLLPEAEQPTSERSSVGVVIEDCGLIIRIVASDVAALRAAFNSYLRWVSAILDVVETVS